jgi:ParB family chromosome partitioning protein
MSLKDKASRINFAGLPGGSPTPTTSSVPGADEARRPRTAPGAMMEFAQGQRSELLRENDELKEKAGRADELRSRLDEALGDLQAWEGAKAARLLDPVGIRHSKFANRDTRSFASPAFEELMAEVASAGGNVQPIKVRPVAGGGYEVVFGHRRLEACKQLGLPVLAMVDSIDDQTLFIEMDRENRGRKDLSPWEQGVMYRRALTEGLFPSNRKLADAVGADLSAVGKALALADLPQEVIEAFSTPMEIQFRWSKPLKDALEADARAVLARAQAARSARTAMNASDVFNLLVTPELRGVEPFHPPAPLEISIGNKKVGTVTVSAKGAVTVALANGVVSPGRVSALQKAIESFLKSK